MPDLVPDGKQKFWVGFRCLYEGLDWEYLPIRSYKEAILGAWMDTRLNIGWVAISSSRGLMHQYIHQSRGILALLNCKPFLHACATFLHAGMVYNSIGQSMDLFVQMMSMYEEQGLQGMLSAWTSGCPESDQMGAIWRGWLLSTCRRHSSYIWCSPAPVELDQNMHKSEDGKLTYAVWGAAEN
jgi:hypothetical protein